MTVKQKIALVGFTIASVLCLTSPKIQAAETNAVNSSIVKFTDRYQIKIRHFIAFPTVEEKKADLQVVRAEEPETEILLTETPLLIDDTPTLDNEIVIEEPINYYLPSEFIHLGVIYYNGYKWTWYSQRVLPGGALEIPGRHVDADGFVCDENDYICLASRDFEKGTILDTPFNRTGKVYDYCPTCGVIDVYCNW